MSQSMKTMMLLGLLTSVGALVGLYAYFGVYEKDSATTQKKDADARLIPASVTAGLDAGAAPEFVKLAITVGGQETVLEREPGAPWRVTSPVRGPADKLVIDGAISQLQAARFKDTLDERPDDATLTKYGLDRPAFTVEAFTRGSDGQLARAVRLEGGIENTFDGSVFMRRSGEPAVYSAPGGVRYALSRSTFDLRDKQLFAVDEVTLRQVSVKARANTFTLTRDAERRWAITAPLADLADTAQVTGMLGAMASEKAQAFPGDTPEHRAAFGLDKPLVDATFTKDDGQTIRLRVSKGGTPEAIYGLREDADGAILAQVTDAALGALDRNPQDLRDRTLLRFQKELVTTIVFHNADGSELVVTRDSPDASVESWRVSAPREGKAKVFKVTSALWTLGAFKALATVETSPKRWDTYGLGPGARFIALSGPDGELARFTIGKPVPNKPNAVYARGSKPEVVEVDGSRFSEFPTIIGDLLDEPPPSPDAGP